MTEQIVQTDFASTVTNICPIVGIPEMRELAECGEGCDGTVCVLRKVTKPQKEAKQ
ncbi:MAG: hypothetical protein WCT01_03940 [Candidatus Shapirobacteria bacterium]